eukprot:UN24844
MEDDFDDTQSLFCDFVDEIDSMIDDEDFDALLRIPQNDLSSLPKIDQPPAERNAKRKRDEDLPLEEVILSPLFKTPSMLATLLCPVCMNVMQEPMVLSPCGHTFCKMCCGKFAPKKMSTRSKSFWFNHTQPSYKVYYGRSSL